MSLIETYRPDGSPCSMEEARHFFEDRNSRIIRQTSLVCGSLDIFVSTVFLVFNHSFSEGGPPVLWETMIFGMPGELDEAQRRYTSREEAVATHAHIVDSALALPGVKLVRDE